MITVLEKNMKQTPTRKERQKIFEALAMTFPKSSTSSVRIKRKSGYFAVHVYDLFYFDETHRKTLQKALTERGLSVISLSLWAESNHPEEPTVTAFLTVL